MLVVKNSFKFALCIVFVAVTGCSESVSTPINMGPPTKDSKNTISEKITLKEFSTGQVASKELESARDKALSWTYFSERRIVDVVSLEDKKVVEIKFGLEDSYEASKLKDEMEARFRSEGSPIFSFYCVSDVSSVNFTDKKFLVTIQNCYAFDEKQTLLITRKYPIKKEPLIEQNPVLKLLLDTGTVTLYDQNLRATKATQESDRLNKQIAERQKNQKNDM